MGRGGYRCLRPSLSGRKEAYAAVARASLAGCAVDSAVDSPLSRL